MRTRSPLLAKPKLFWKRLTLSKLTICYFIFSVVHATIQVALQAKALSIDTQAVTFLSNIVQQGNITTNGFMIYSGQDLRMCSSVPASLQADSCSVIWDGTPVNDTEYWTSTGNQMEAISGTTTPTSVRSTSSTLIFQSSMSSTSTSTSGSPTSSNLRPSSSNPLSQTTSRPGTTLHTVPSATPLPALTLVSSSDDLPEENVADHLAEAGLYLPYPLPLPYFPFHRRHTKRDLFSTGVLSTNTNVTGQIQVHIDGFGFKNNEVILDISCLWSLNWPISSLRNTERENIVFIAFQLWVLGMSVVAILNQSIPHVLASLLTHMLATAWSGFLIGTNANFRTNFSRLTTQGTCKPINLIPWFWKPRSNLLTASLALNVAALVIATVLSWQLTKAFGWMTFKRIGASRQINRQYRVVLFLSIAIQLGLFFIVASIGLWIDQLYNGAIARLTSNISINKAVLIVVLLLLFPWLITGWFSARREWKIPMWIFLGLSFGYLVGWASMFALATFRWTFMQWYFFGVMTCASVFLTMTALVVGGVCLLGFGEGLPRYLNPDQPLLEDYYGHASPSDIEKVDFPSADGQIPTFSAIFGSGNEASRNRVLGFTSSDPRILPHPSIAHLRPLSLMSRLSDRDSLTRSDSIGSHITYASSTTTGSLHSSGTQKSNKSGYRSARSARPDRWVIE